jgi:hypothetical protein
MPSAKLLETRAAAARRRDLLAPRSEKSLPAHLETKVTDGIAAAAWIDAARIIDRGLTFRQPR